MRHNHPAQPMLYPLHTPIIDWEFDKFDIDDEIQADRREIETASFYHDGFGLEE
ncbi:MAG: hypothetical protein K2Q32_02700 [Alphaproteobacteria bacterium]|nr:hypothetical protein [Alphaproteobacteria bacterium]